MAHDLDDEELKATRKLNGLDKEGIEKNIKNLKEYIKKDDIYARYKNGEYNELSDFEMFCINHCKDIEDILSDYTRQKQINEEHRKENGLLREKVKELEAKLEFKQYGDLDDLRFEEYMNEFILKENIKNRIKELKIIQEENADEIKKNVRFYSIYDSYELQINELQELLQESEEK